MIQILLNRFKLVDGHTRTPYIFRLYEG
jgi:hypothetical protein